MTPQLIHRLAAALFLPLLLLGAIPANAQNATYPVIVRYQPGVTDAQIERTLTSSPRSRIWGHQSRRARRLAAVHGYALDASMADLARLVADARVKGIYPDREVRGTLEFARGAIGADVAFQALDLDGQGVGVAVIDSGVNGHSDFNGSSISRAAVRYHEDFTGTKGELWDEYGHGTHVAGIIAGNGKQSTKNAFKLFMGIAPAASIVDLRVLDESGRGRDSYVIAAIGRAIELRERYDIRVINLSLGRPVFESHTEDPLCAAVKAAWEAGITVVAAAGNSGRDNSWDNNGYGTITAPGNSPYAITVGAMKPRATVTPFDDEMASYSSKGPTVIDHVVKPDIVAPGNRIISANAENSYLATNYVGNVVPLAYYQYKSDEEDEQPYIRLSGTSMAAPMVAGAAALLIQNDPAMTPDQVKAVLMLTASKRFPTTSTAVHPETGEVYETAYDIFTVGAGYLNIPAALAFPGRPEGLALSPSVSFDETTQEIRLIEGESVIWGRSVAWGSRMVWGYSAISADEVSLSGQGVVWGGRSMRAFDTIWSQYSPWTATTGVNVASGGAEAMSVLRDGEE